MATYNQASVVRTFSLTSDSRFNGLMFADPAYRNAWSTRSGGTTQISYSFIWAGGVASRFTSTYGAEPTAGTAVPSAAYGEIAQAFQQWANVANISFRQVTETSGGTVGDIRIGLSSSVDTDTWGYAKVSANGSDNSHGDIWINPTWGNQSFAVDTYNFAAMMHEIGHALGLADPSSGSGLAIGYDQRNYTIMSYNDPYGVYVYNATRQNFDYILRTPMVYDIAAIQAIYGANTSYNAGDTKYVYSPDDPFYATIWDAGGTNTIDLRAFTQASFVDLHPGAYSTLGFNGAAVSNNLGIAYGVHIETLFGGSGSDTLVGDDLLNRIYAGKGDDRIYGYGGNDRLSGGPGNDIISGGDGNDLFLAGDDTGNDRYVGGPGNDLVTYAGAKAGVTINLATGVGNGTAAGLGTDTISGIERATGGAYNDTVIGDGYDNVLGQWRQRHHRRGRGQGYLARRGGLGPAHRRGRGRPFRVRAGIEFGGTTATTCDVITDFSHAQGDTIVLNPIDANTRTPDVDDAFTFIGTAAFHGVAGELRYTASGANTLVLGDVNGDGQADFALLLLGAISLTKSDFVL
jgi:serralysin